MNIFMMEYINNNDEYNIYIYEYMHISYIYWIYYIQLSQRINEEHIHQYSNIEISGLVIPNQFWIQIPKENLRGTGSWQIRILSELTPYHGPSVPSPVDGMRTLQQKNRPNGRYTWNSGFSKWI